VTLFEVQFRKLPEETEESSEEYLPTIAGFQVETWTWIFLTCKSATFSQSVSC